MVGLQTILVGEQALTNRADPYGRSLRAGSEN